MQRILASLYLAVVLTAAATDKPYRLVEVTSSPVTPAARALLDEINDAFLLLGLQPSSFWEGRTHTQNAQMREEAQLRIRALALRFVFEHPQDPLRWVAVHQMLASTPAFIVGFKPGFDASERPDPAGWIVDETTKADWTAELARWEAALESAADVPWEVREHRAFVALAPVVREAVREGAVAIGAAERRLEAHAARYPEGGTALQLLQQLHRARLQAGGEAAHEIWGRHAGSSNRALAERAAAELRRAEAARQPVELAFTAVDGRAVDLAHMRGKVVLLDFWATWCGPCIAEIPNLKTVYEKYHAHGFEIVGITLENARLAPGDSPEQTGAKLAAARRVLTEFTAARDMKWPQHFDGRFWKNEIAQRFAVTGIPAMFLLDQQGRLVTPNARGEKLETEVRRLLGL